MKNQKGIGLLEVLIAALILALVVTGSLVLLTDFSQTMRDSNERTAALYKLSSVMEVHRHNPYLVDVYTPSLMVGIPSVESFYLVDATTEELEKRIRYTAAIEWLNQYDGEMQGFSLSGLHMFGPRHLCILSDCPILEQPPVDEEPSDDTTENTDGTIEYANDDTTDDTTGDDGYSTCKDGDNGFGNGDGYAPGNSGPNNNAANAGDPEWEDCEDTTGNDWKFPT